MSKGKGKSVDEVQQSVPRAKKYTLLLRPRNSPLELDFLSWRPLESLCRPSPKNITQLGFHLLGVGIVIASICILLANVFQNFTPGSLLSANTSSPGLASCAEKQPCLNEKSENGDPASSVTKVVPVVTGQTPTPTVGVRPDPTAAGSATPDSIPSMPLLVAAQTILTVSRFDICDPGRSTPLVLMNKGGAALLWSEDTTKTSRGISVTDPKSAYLILPGKSARVTVWCRRNLPVAKYMLVIDFNGGSVSIEIDVTR